MKSGVTDLDENYSVDEDDDDETWANPSPHDISAHPDKDKDKDKDKDTNTHIQTLPGGHVWYQLVPGHNGALGLADLQNVKHYSRNCQHCQKWVWTLDYIKYIRWRLLISTWTIEICVWSSFKTFLTQLTAEVCDPAAEGVVIIPHMRWERRDGV